MAQSLIWRGFAGDGWFSGRTRGAKVTKMSINKRNDEQKRDELDDIRLWLDQPVDLEAYCGFPDAKSPVWAVLMVVAVAVLFISVGFLVMLLTGYFPE